MLKVLIDTNGYEAHGLSFKGPLYDRLIKLAEDRRLKVYMSQVVQREIEEHLQVSVSKGVNALKETASSNDHNIKMFIADGAELAPLIDQLMKGQKDLKARILEARKGALEGFINKAEIEMVTSEGVDSAQIMADYFDKKAPFGEGNKKHEFPDAFALHRYLGLVTGDSPWYVVSNDGGWKDFATANATKLASVDTISAFVDLANKYVNAQLTEELHTVVKDNPSIVEALQTAFGRLDFYIDSYIDAEIELEEDTIQIEIDDIDLINFADGIAEWSCEFTANYNLTVGAEDEESGYRDSDTKEWMYMGRNTYELSVTSYLTAIIKSNFDEGDVNRSFTVESAVISPTTVSLDDDDFTVDAVTDWREYEPEEDR